MTAQRKRGFYEKYIKRLLDIVICSAIFIVISPILLLIAILIKLTSDGPVFFLQERLGLDQKAFKIIKFRTMIVNAERIGDGLKVREESDPRITPIGRILRKTSLDELPQLINIIKGDMSIIGPRPPVTYHPYKKGEYDDRKKHRFDVRPGLTGLAQSKIRNSGTWDERIEYDLIYVENVSFRQDIKVVFDTVKMLFNKEALY